MKRVMCCLLILMLIFTAAQAEACYVVKTPGGWLNMRKEPDPKAPIKEFIPNGDDVSLVEFVDEDWAKITWKGINGYVKRTFIMTLDEALKADYPDSAAVYPDVTQVFAREKPDPESKILAVKNREDRIMVLEEKDGWCYVSVEREPGESVFAWIPVSDVQSRRAEPMTEEEMKRPSPILVGEMRSAQTACALPDKSSEKQSALKMGMTVLVHEIYLPWCYVTAEDLSGWVMASQVHLTGDEWKEEENALSTPAPEDENAFITLESAREKSDAALESAYPAFDSAGMAVEHERVSESERVYYQFAYFLEGAYVYAARIDAYHGEVISVADYTAFAPANATPAPAGRPGQAGSGKPEDQKISKSQAKFIAVMALQMDFPGFDPDDYPNVQYSECKMAPGLSFEGMFFRLDFYTRDGSGHVCCILDARTGVVVHTSSAPGADAPGPDEGESESPPPSPEAELISEGRARSISDSALSGKYSAFSSTVFSRVWVRYNEADVGFGPHTYHVDYYNEIGDCAYSCVMDAFTGAVKYTNGVTQ